MIDKWGLKRGEPKSCSPKRYQNINQTTKHGNRSSPAPVFTLDKTMTVKTHHFQDFARVPFS